VNAKHVLGTARKRLVKHLSVGLVVKRELNYTRSVAQVYKNKCSKVSLTLYPAHNADLLTYHLLGNLRAVTGSLVLIS
jgi:hypothetical protein